MISRNLTGLLPSAGRTAVGPWRNPSPATSLSRFSRALLEPSPPLEIAESSHSSSPESGRCNPSAERGPAATNGCLTADITPMPEVNQLGEVRASQLAPGGDLCDRDPRRNEGVCRTPPLRKLRSLESRVTGHELRRRGTEHGMAEVDRAMTATHRRASSSIASESGNVEGRYRPVRADACRDAAPCCRRSPPLLGSLEAEQPPPWIAIRPPTRQVYACD